MQSNKPYDISVHRKAIDEVDHKIYQLLIERIKIIHRVKSIKKEHVKKGSSIRPARAIEVIRNACNGLSSHYHQNIIIDLWRTLISISEYSEQEFAIIALNQDCYWQGQEFFSSVVEATIEEDIDKLISYLCRFDCHFGFVPFPNNTSDNKWWVNLINNTPKVFAIAPLYKSNQKSALAIGHVMLEPTYKNDFTLFAINDTSKLQEDLLVLDKEKDLNLVQINQFYDEEQVAKLGGHLLGNYSTI